MCSQSNRSRGGLTTEQRILILESFYERDKDVPLYELCNSVSAELGVVSPRAVRRFLTELTKRKRSRRAMKHPLNGHKQAIRGKAVLRRHPRGPSRIH